MTSWPSTSRTWLRSRAVFSVVMVAAYPGSLASQEAYIAPTCPESRPVIGMSATLQFSGVPQARPRGSTAMRSKCSRTAVGILTASSENIPNASPPGPPGLPAMTPRRSPVAGTRLTVREIVAPSGSE